MAKVKKEDIVEGRIWRHVNNSSARRGDLVTNEVLYEAKFVNDRIMIRCETYKTLPSGSYGTDWFHHPFRDFESGFKRHWPPEEVGVRQVGTILGELIKNMHEDSVKELLVELEI